MRLIVIILLSFVYSTVTDIDGNVYETVQIGNQLWMKENLKVTHYNNGNPISYMATPMEWQNGENGKYGDPNNNASHVETYGYLYDWYSVGTMELCMEDWYVPSDDEFKDLEMFLGMSQEDADEDGTNRGTDEGGKLKETGFEHWNNPNTGATNESGFSALPSGYKTSDGDPYSFGNWGAFWSSSNDSEILYDGSELIYCGFNRYMTYQSATVARSCFNPNYGLSVRCIYDLTLGTDNYTPIEYNIISAYPNPFNPVTNISFEIPLLSNVIIQIYNIRGEMIEELFNGIKSPGKYNITWNATRFTSGIYFVSLISQDFVSTQKIMLIK